MNKVQPAVQNLAQAVEQFAVALDSWVLRYPVPASDHRLDCVVLSQARLAASQLVAALRWGPSVGLYGESQAGKSALVSGFGAAMGARRNEEGSLLLRDSTPETERPGPWREAAGQVADVEFERWLDPGKSSEATGTVCRFVADFPDERKGCYLVELLTLSEFVCSLTMGYHVESKQVTDPDQPKRLADKLAKELDYFWSCKREPDPQRVMEHLLHAWNFLKGDSRFAGSTHFRVLDDAMKNKGWDEFVHDCVRERKRPVFSEGTERDTDLDRFVGMLWGSEPAVTALWRKLSRRLVFKLRAPSRVWVPVKDVCKDRPGNETRPSLIDVSLISDGARADDACSVESTEQPSRGKHSLPRWELAALARCVVLPMARDGETPEGSADIDVIDFPGAREGQNDLDFSVEEKADKHARDALVRGRVLCLFAKTIDLHDATALCLVQKGGDNNTAAKSITSALKSWLAREEWHGLQMDAPEPIGQYGDTAGPQPPLVVAITKVDTFVEQGVAAVAKQLEKLGGYSNVGKDWLKSWTPQGEPFADVFWVHNPRKAKRPLSKSELAKKVLDQCLEHDEIRRHSHEPDEQFKALLAEKPADIQRLYQRIQSLAVVHGRSDLRVARLAQRLLALAADLERKTSFYAGRGDERRKREYEKKAHAHVTLLRSSLSKSHVFAEFLLALSVDRDLVVRSYVQASQRAAGDEEDTHGAADFAGFYRQLCANFVARLDGALKGDRRWGQGITQEQLDDLIDMFRRLPGQGWFEGPIAEAAGNFINDYDATNTQAEVLASVVASIWNRHMVWLGKMPPTQPTPAEAPKRLGEFEPSESILEHWAIRLPEVYQELVDPQDKTAPFNQELGRHRGAFCTAVADFLEAVRHEAVRHEAAEHKEIVVREEWAAVIGGANSLREQLSEEGDPAVTGPVKGA